MRPSTSQGFEASGARGDLPRDVLEELRPSTADAPVRDSTLPPVYAGGSVANLDQSEYRRRLDDFRQLSALGIDSGDACPGLTDFLRFSRPAKLTGMRDELKLETISRAYGISRAPSRRHQLSPVKRRHATANNGSTLLNCTH